jgi:serine/threonine protein kinase
VSDDVTSESVGEPHDEPATRFGGLPPAPSSPSATESLAPEDRWGGTIVIRAAGQLIGPYRLERPLGRGGFGEVWCALHESLRRRVALKLLRPDRLGERSLRRFEVERESLRLLAHPNVAKIYDAGTTDDGAPFIAMEFIEGVPLTQYCDRLRLTLAERLRLFAGVCDAMQYVHLQGIIHRDLSPDNILVSLSGPEEGQPKIIDFGIARAASGGLRLSEETVGEEFGHVVGKLMYMSPEQAEAGPAGVDARTDIYALGVILYELLAGVLPVDPSDLRARALSQAVKILVESDRPTPATRVRRLSDEERRRAAEARREHDVDAFTRHLDDRVKFVPLTAMHVDRSKRFSSAAAMAEDIRAYLEGRDFTHAARDPWWDKARRHVRRHRLLWGAIAAVFVALALGIVATGLAWREATRNAELAEDRLAVNTSVLAYLTDDLLGADEHMPAPASTTIETLVARSPAKIAERFEERPEIQARLLGALGSWAIQMADQKRAYEMLTAAHAAARQSGADPLELARIDVLRAEALWRDTRDDASSSRAERLGKALELAQAAAATLASGNGPLDPDALAARNQVANALKHSGRSAEAEGEYRAILVDRRRVLPAEHIDVLIAEYNLGLAIFMQAKVEKDPTVKAKRIEEALAIVTPNWERTKKARGERDPQSLAAGSEVAAMLNELGRVADADQVYTGLVPLMQGTLGESHWRTRTTMANHARLLFKAGELDRAIPALERSMRAFEEADGLLAETTATVAMWLVEAIHRHGEADRARRVASNHLAAMAAQEISSVRDHRAASFSRAVADLQERLGDADGAREWRERQATWEERTKVWAPKGATGGP